jgi:NADH oxidase (H2O2-forming)
MQHHEIIVIGGGPAAITLAKQLGKEKDIAVIRPEDHSMIYCAMPYVIEGLLHIERTLKKDTLVTDAGAVLIRGTADSVDFSGKVVTLADGTTFSYDMIVIATGAEPFIPPIPGAGLKGVTGFKTEKNLAGILDFIKSGLRRAVVVGAGAIGIELALALCDAGLTVDLVDMAASILPNLLDREMTEEVEAEVIRKGVNLHLGAKVMELEGHSSVEHVLLDNGVKIHFDPLDECSEESETLTHEGIVIFAAGMKTNLDLVKGSGIELGRDGILVNNRMETSMKDVYAAGDCTQYVSGITGNPVPGKLATNAVPMGRVLADNLLGKDHTYPGFFNGAATRVGQFFVGGTGLSETAAVQAGFKPVTGYSEVTTQFPIMPEAKKMRMKIIADTVTQRLLGAQIVSGEPVTGRIDLLTFAIQKQSVLSEMIDLSYSSQPYQSFFPAANSIVLAADDALKKLS